MAGAIGKTMWNRKLYVLTDIAEAHAETGDRAATMKAWDDALQAAETGSEKVGVLLRIAEARTKAGDRRAALGTLDRAAIAARSIKESVPPSEAGDLGPPGSAAAGIAKARAQAGDIVGAVGLAKTIPNNQVQGDALAEIAAVQAESGDIRGAFRTAASIRPPDPAQRFITHLADRTSAMMAIMAVQARAGDVAAALVTADRLDSPEVRQIAPLLIAEALARRNEPRKRAEPPHGP